MKFLDGLAPHAHWFLRIALASVFLYHGLGKFINFAATSEMMGVPMAAIAGIMETAGGLLVLGGAFSGKDTLTRIGGLLIAPVMLAAIFMVHLENGWNFQNNGIEFQFTLLMIAVYFLLRGNGPGSAA